MDHSQAPVLAALGDYQRRGDIPFSPPGHKQARGADKRVVDVLGAAVFYSDMVATAGLTTGSPRAGSWNTPRS